MRILITGGAGFIGINSAKRFIEEGQDVIIFDNLSRKGSEDNINWLKKFGDFNLVKGDLRNFDQIKKCFLNNKIDVVLHLGAQVAVTKSVENPREDFEINALGTFNICEAVRRYQPESILLNSSTNKVYGKLEFVDVVEKEKRYEYKDLKFGISETTPLDFYSPYGCSKGCADQYIRDYARIYNLKTVNFRQSCIYGPRQFGVEDQGWVAWFTICSVLGKPVTIYGNGKQVRDVLFVDDLIECYVKAIKNIEKIKGEIYNIGGGPTNTISILELISLLEEFSGNKLKYSFSEWRPGDQKVFICDIRKAKNDLGWYPKINVREGIKKLFDWVSENKELFR